jgi:glycogen(starch) synthase
MRVLFWSGAFWPTIGGVEVIARKLLPALQRRGHEFTVVTPKSNANSPDEDEYEGIPVYRFSFQNHFTPSAVDYVIGMRRKIDGLKRAFLPDLVHINAVNRSDFFYLTTSQTPRLPLLVTLHGQWENQIEPVVEQTLRRADWVAGCSAAMLDRGRQLVPEIGARSSVVYNGIEMPLLAPEPLPYDPPRIACLGRLSPEKGMDVALAAFVSVLDRFPEARLIIGGDGALKAELEKQAADLGIASSVDFIGWVPPEGVPALINTSTMVLMPSRQESLGLVALEAASMARPIVATRVGGLPEVVKHQETGLLVEKENYRELAESIVFLLENREVAVRMGQAARARAQTVFSWERHVDAYDELYRKLTAGAREGASIHAQSTNRLSR